MRPNANALAAELEANLQLRVANHLHAFQPVSLLISVMKMLCIVRRCSFVFVDVRTFYMASSKTTRFSIHPIRYEATVGSGRTRFSINGL